MEDNLLQSRWTSSSKSLSKGRREHCSLSLFGVLNLWTSHTRHFAELNNDIKIKIKKLKLPFSASGARTSKIISFFSCSVCFWKSRTSSSAILVEANCSLLDSEKTEEYHRHVIKENNSSLLHRTSYVQSIEIIITFFACVKVFLDPA